LSVFKKIASVYIGTLPFTNAAHHTTSFSETTPGTIELLAKSFEPPNLLTSSCNKFSTSCHITPPATTTLGPVKNTHIDIMAAHLDIHGTQRICAAVMSAKCWTGFNGIPIAIINRPVCQLRNSLMNLNHRTTIIPIPHYRSAALTDGTCGMSNDKPGLHTNGLRRHGYQLLTSASVNAHSRSLSVITRVRQPPRTLFQPMELEMEKSCPLLLGKSHHQATHG
jgi:hypothetical protein